MKKNKNIYDKLEKNVPMPKGGKVEVGYPTGGVEIPTPKAGEVMSEKVKGQKVMPEKVRIAKWY
jgi:hypothetical protein